MRGFREDIADAFNRPVLLRQSATREVSRRDLRKPWSCYPYYQIPFFAHSSRNPYNKGDYFCIYTPQGEAREE